MEHLKVTDGMNMTSRNSSNHPTAISLTLSGFVLLAVKLSLGGTMWRRRDSLDGLESPVFPRSTHPFGVGLCSIPYLLTGHHFILRSSLRSYYHYDKEIGMESEQRNVGTQGYKYFILPSILSSSLWSSPLSIGDCMYPRDTMEGKDEIFVFSHRCNLWENLNPLSALLPLHLLVFDFPLWGENTVPTEE